MKTKLKTNSKNTPVWKDTHRSSANDMNRNITTTKVTQDDTEEKGFVTERDKLSLQHCAVVLQFMTKF